VSIPSLGSGSKSGYVKVESRSATQPLYVPTPPDADSNCGAYANADTGADTNRSIDPDI